MAKDPIAQARILEHKADQLKDRGKFKKAFELYEEALDLDETRVELYDKLIAVHAEFQDEWTEDDFAYNVHLSMQKQEILDPSFKRIHAQHEPEYKNATKIIRRLLDAKDEKLETKIIEDIASLGEDAIYPLIDFLLGFKKIMTKKKQPK